VGVAPLCVRFPRLYDLAENKGVMVREMARRGWTNGGDAWERQRRLLAWEEESVTECSSLLCNFVLQDHVLDRWRWVSDPVNGYSVKGTYQYLMLSDTSLERGLFDTAWLKQVPLFGGFYATDSLPKTISSIGEFFIMTTFFCIGGCGCTETTSHLLFRCDIFGNVWHGVYQWLCISFISPDSVREHLIQFGHLMGLPRSTQSFFKVTWHACVWIVWKERNNRIFKSKALDLGQLVDKVKFVSFSWLRANRLTSAFSYNDWWRHPLICMGVRE
jgi:hypothetical protein